MIKTSILTVAIRNKDRVLYSGQAYAVTSLNDKGPFDILAKHENFISLIKTRIAIHTTSTEKKEIQIKNGILRVYRDKVYAYVNFSS